MVAFGGTAAHGEVTAPAPPPFAAAPADLDRVADPGPLPIAKSGPEDAATLRAPDLPETRVELAPTAAPEPSEPAPGGEPPVGEVKSSPISGAMLRWRASQAGRDLRVRLHSSGAVGLRFALDRASLGPDVEVRVYAPDGRERYGPYRPGADGRGGEWWSPLVSGEAVGIEFHSDAAGLEDSRLPTVTQVAHLYENRLYELPCHNDIACRPEWVDASYAVAKMLFNRDGQVFTCSGALINRPTNDRPPLFLTANHCISTDAVASTLTTLFFYQDSTCGGAPRTVQQVLGSELLARQATYDVSLLGLSQPVPTGVTFLDYDVTNPFPYGSFVGCIHHPRGTKKRYSAGGLTNSGIEAFTDIGDVSVWIVTLDDGAVEPGSSGSPLLDSSRRIHGVLTGTESPAVCPDETAYYGRFDLAYETLSPFLGDIPSPVWCNPAASGDQYGTVLFPFATLRRALNFCIAPGGTLRLWAGHYAENPTITQPMTIEAFQGSVTIGTP